jgi:hypothetical protein
MINRIREEPAAVPAVPRIYANQIFDLETARAVLQLPESTLPRECRLGRLRHGKRAGKIFILGKWIIQWIETSEIHRRRRRASLTHATNSDAKGSNLPVAEGGVA